MTTLEIQDLKKTADLNWCIDILKRVDDILRKPNISLSDLSQIHYLVKQGLKVEREE
jgi:hypothetical protein